ncbi:MAG: glycosyltransferase [Qingshengfaniella sp.]
MKSTALPENGPLLIYAPVPVYRQDGVDFLERQAANGLRLWAQNFAGVISMNPQAPGPPPPGWVPATEIAPWLDRVRMEPIPMAYRPDHFLRHLWPARHRIGALIDEARYLSFAIGGLFGDWGAVACYMAHRRGRPFAVWTDRVESEVTRLEMAAQRARTRWRARLTHGPMARMERDVIKKAPLGLFHGRETYDTYASYSRNPHLVHDIHVAAENHIPPDRLARKIATAGVGPLRIIYAGRAEPMKGPLDWIETLIALEAQGVPFQATWLGDGSERPEMMARIAAAGLDHCIATPGFVSDPSVVLEALRDAHVFLFCHKTPESPRSPIEALISGAVLVGYDGGFVRDITAERQSGRFVAIGDRDGLVAELAALDRDRDRLAGLMHLAVEDGAPFDDVTVFRHRSDLIKQYL